MEFILRYRGSLPAKSKGVMGDKQRIRAHFHSQLLELCRAEEMFQPATGEVPVVPMVGRRLDPQRPLGSNLFFRVELGDTFYTPLVSDPHKLACEIDITWLRGQQPGKIYDDGDLDNRLKNLLDGLRMPHQEKEVIGHDLDIDGDRCYCLMEDDSLITKLSVSTYQLLEQDVGSDVDLLIQVTVVATRPMWGNVGI